MKLLIVGPAQHGKDFVSTFLCLTYNLTYKSSSMFCLELFIFDALKDQYGYATPLDAYNDRDNHRAEWFNLIAEYNKDDAARLGKAIFNEYDVYNGLRNAREFWAMKEQGVFDASIWVDASKRKPPEPTSSMTLRQDWMDYTIDNNGTKPEAIYSALKVMERILG